MLGTPHNPTSGRRVGITLVRRASCSVARKASSPPHRGRVDRIVRSALRQGEHLLFARITARLSTEVWRRWMRWSLWRRMTLASTPMSGTFWRGSRLIRVG
jgi:hypothetical protein